MREMRLQLELDLHTGGQIQGHQGLHGLGGGVGDVDQTLVGAALKLLAAVLILMGSPQDGDDLLLGCLLYTSPHQDHRQGPPRQERRVRHQQQPAEGFRP